MGDRYIFMCTNDLNKLRKSYGWTIDALSERAHISPRTLNRIEYANGTRNESMARKLAEAFGKPFEDFFIRVSEYVLRCLESAFPPLSEWNLIPDMTYYTLYVRRVSGMEADTWGKRNGSSSMMRAMNSAYYANDRLLVLVICVLQVCLPSIQRKIGRDISFTGKLAGRRK